MRPKINFTQDRIKNLAPPTTGRTEYRDTAQPKLILRVTPAGTKTFAVLKKDQGKVRRYTLGRWPDVSVAEARTLAARALVEVAAGADPRELKKQRKAQSMTLGEVFEQYLSDRARHLKPRTVTDYRLKIRYFRDWQRRPVTGIDEDAVLHRHKEIAEAGETTANNAMRVLRLILNYAVTLGATDRNPVRVLSRRKLWFRNKRRKDVIDADQMPAWYATVVALAHRRASMFLLLMLHMGLRPSEALGLEWADVELSKARLTVRNPKNHQDHELPVPRALLPFFRQIHAETGSGKWVFPADRGDKPMGTPRMIIGKVIAESGVQFLPSDLRRTFCTLAEVIGLPLMTTKRLMNHLTDSNVTGGYIRLDETALRSAIDRIAAEITTRSAFPGVEVMHG